MLGDLRHLTELYLTGATVGDKELGCLAGLKRLEVLDLHETSVGDAGLCHVVGLNSIRDLSITDNQDRSEDSRDLSFVTDEGMKFVGKLSSLKVLRVSCEHVSDRGVAELRGLSMLTSLNLSLTKVTDSSFLEIGRFSHLKKLNLAYTQVTGAGVEAFKLSHPDVRVIWAEGGGLAESPDF